MRTGTRSRRSAWPRRSPAQAGRDGERFAALLYLLCGYRVVGRDVRTPHAQVDLVCRRGGTLVVVEVKRRRTRGLRDASAGLSPRQAARLRAAARHMRATCSWARTARVDLVAIDGWRVRIRTVRG